MYDVVRPSNVVLYMEHFHTGGGITGDEIGNEQTEVHEVTGSTLGADIYGNGTGGRIQPMKPTIRPIRRHSPWRSITFGTRTGRATVRRSVSRTETASRLRRRWNGIDLTFVESDELTEAELANVTAYGQTEDGLEVTTGTPDGLNRFELGGIENEYHDDDSLLHMLWGTMLANDEPKTLIDQRTDYASSAGLAWHVGSPDAPAVRTIESDFGIMIARDQFQPNEYQDLQSVGLHELGHALSVGWADNGPIPVPILDSFLGQKAFEVYNGNQNRPSITGGIDPTPENINAPNPTPSPTTPRWSVMSAGTATDTRTIGSGGSAPILMFSLEELSTVDLNDISSRKE